MSAAAQAGLPAEKPTIFVIDDDPALCSSLKFALELEGFVVRTYGDAAALLSDMNPTRADCLIIDQRLPGLNGIELLEKLRSRDLRRRRSSSPAIRAGDCASRPKRAGVQIVEKPLLGSALHDEIRRLSRPADVADKPDGKAG